jgi:uncharacterized iron-regulated membrane protein
VAISPPRPAPSAPARRGGTGRRARRRISIRIRRALQLLHRWIALAFGLLALVVVVSGVVVLFVPETERLAHPSHFEATPTADPISPEQAAAAAERAVPGMRAENVVRYAGVYDVYRYGTADAEPLVVHVDPGTGRVLGESAYQDGVLGFVQNLHMCFLSCEGYPGYLAFLAQPSGAWEVTWGAWILGSAGVVLLVLSLSGLWLWWPGVRNWARGFRVRRGQGAYKRDFDLHKVVGFATLPLVVMWAFTGAAWEFPVLERAWYAVMPGSQPPEHAEVQSRPGSGDGVSPTEAEQIARRLVPDGEPVSVSLPAEDTEAYSVWLSRGIDVYEHGAFPGNVEVAVDRWSGRPTITYDASRAGSVAELWEGWQWGLHTGTFASWEWRALLYVPFGLVPLLLAVTGLRTWLHRRRLRRMKRSRRPVAEAT